MVELEKPHRETLPSLSDALIFRLKTIVFQTKRSLENITDRQFQRFSPAASIAFENIAAESRTSLWQESAGNELQLQAGKVHNLRIALQQINNIIVPANAVFSFWAQLGRPTRLKGYVYGRELREGCLIPSIGGGLCQLSNALYDAALSAQCEIIERHAHTRVIPGSLAELGRDATVFWNYVDLRFRAEKTFQIEAFLTKDQLVVRLRMQKRKLPILSAPNSKSATSATHLGSCDTCGEISCFRNIENPTAKFTTARTAYLVDEYWPEFDQYINKQKQSRDLLAIPLDGKRFNKPNYRWNTAGFDKVRQPYWTTLRRSIASRSLAQQGAARQRVLLKFEQQLARSYSSLLTYDVTHVSVMQNLLPHLWQAGYLGGRSFDVLMTRLPLAELQRRLDQAYQLYPQSSTLADFRADAALIAAEQAALAQAEKIITPHREIAELFKDRAVLLDWQLPARKESLSHGTRIIFPASTLGRKGAYELRKVALDLQLEITLLGAQLESNNFWQGVKIACQSGYWLDDAAMVVLPAHIEDKPRRLLEAVANNVPVIASSACGLKSMPGVINIPSGDTQALRNAIEELRMQKVAIRAAV